ncbi:Uma2 family endonuclease [Acaryochloris sp. IP29b_bin.137]|uniref:Uma2 family endonuclease n=1 Tax=Acaryochloris sp. IP29b_bin.137 TaxID=2969217 RepID=UPI0026045680|nr:Uma2 family endonuclease [Acaryochloris sp. IP29b_bin.137]
MVHTPSKSLTLQAFLKLPETKPASEFINGEIIQKPMPRGRHSRLQGKLCATINQSAEESKIAYTFSELRCSFGGRSIVPDVAIFQWNRIPFTASGEVPDHFDLAPDWTIEIFSPDQRPNKVLGHILHCLEYGSHLGWFIDPDDLSILFCQPQQQPILCQNDHVLPTFPDLGLSLTANQVFDWLKMG